eukprot:Rmarinus@m.6745
MCSITPFVLGLLLLIQQTSALNPHALERVVIGLERAEFEEAPEYHLSRFRSHLAETLGKEEADVVVEMTGTRGPWTLLVVDTAEGVRRGELMDVVAQYHDCVESHLDTFTMGQLEADGIDCEQFAGYAIDVKPGPFFHLSRRSAARRQASFRRHMLDATTTAPPTTPAPATVPDSERDALVALYDYLGGDAWTVKTNWLDPDWPVCDWYGITCNDARSTVTRISLADNGLTVTGEQGSGRRLLDVLSAVPGRPRLRRTLHDHLENHRHHHAKTLVPLNDPEHLGKYDKVIHDIIGESGQQRRKSERVELRRLAQAVTAEDSLPVLPDAVMSGLPNLEHLDLSLNPLVGAVIPDTLPAHFPKLKELGLFACGLEGTIPEEMGSMHLTSIDLGKFVSFCSDLVCEYPFPSKKVDMSWINVMGQEDGWANAITGLIDPLMNITSLERLHADYNLLEGNIVSDLLCEMVNLRDFNVAMNGASYGYIPECIDEVSQLGTFLVGNSEITGSIPRGFGMTSLMFVVILSTRVDGELPDTLGNLNFLFEWHLTANFVTGNIPDGLCSLPLLTTLNIADNAMSGRLPDVCSTLSSALADPSSGLTKGPLFMILNGNSFTGDLTEFDFSGWQNLVMFMAQNTEFEGPVPVDLFTLPALMVVDLQGNRFEGTLPDEMFSDHIMSISMLNVGEITGELPPSIGAATNLGTFILSDADISGTIPEEVCQLKALATWTLANMPISGTIPECVSEMTALETLKFTEIDVVGGLPEGMGNLDVLKYIQITYCGLDTTYLPPSMNDMEQLIELTLSHNQLSGRLTEYLSKVNFIPTLFSIDVSYNHIFGEIPSKDLAYSGLGDPIFPRLFQFSINNNDLDYVLPFSLGTLSALRVVNLHSNHFVGVVPDTFDVFTVLTLHDNELGCSTDDPEYLDLFCDEMLPEVFVLTGSFVETRNVSGVSCPSVTSATGNAIVTLDPTYYNMTLCKCEARWTGVSGRCSECLVDGTFCPGSDTSAAINHNTGDEGELPIMQVLDAVWTIPGKLGADAGYYPTPNLENPTHIIKCHEETLESSKCNPGGHLGFQCDDGYESRLCSRCIEGYYPNGFQCRECPPTGVVVGVVFVVFVVLVLVFLALVVQHKRFLRLDDAMKSFLFYMQTVLLIFSNTGFVWPDSVLIVKRFYGYASFSIEIFGCVNSSGPSEAMDSYIMTVSSIVYAFLLVTVFFGIEYMYKVAMGRTNHEIYELFLRCAHAFLFAINVLYLPISVRALEVFLCEEDPGDGKSYMATAEWVECDPDGEWGRMRNLSVFIVIVFTCGVPLLFWYLLYVNRHNRADGPFRYMLRFLHQCYSPRFYWYELTTFARRLALGVFAATLGTDNAFTPFFISVIIMASTLSQAYFRPFATFALNGLEAVAHMVLGLTFLCGAIFTLDFDKDSAAIKTIEGFAVFINVACGLMFILLGVRITLFPKSFMFLDWKEGAESEMDIGSKEFELTDVVTDPDHPWSETSKSCETPKSSENGVPSGSIVQRLSRAFSTDVEVEATV